MAFCILWHRKIVSCDAYPVIVRSPLSILLCEMYTREINRVHQSNFHRCFPAYFVFIATLPPHPSQCARTQICVHLYFSVLFRYFWFTE